MCNQESERYANEAQNDTASNLSKAVRALEGANIHTKPKLNINILEVANGYVINQQNDYPLIAHVALGKHDVIAVVAKILGL